MTRRYRDPRSVVAVLATALSVAPSAGEELFVGAATSLRQEVEASARLFESAHHVVLRFSYGASDALAAQARAGAPFDVLLSADAAVTDALAKEGLCETAQPLARNRLVVVARPEIAVLRAPADLAGPAVKRIAIPGIGVPVGRYAREWLGARGLLERVEERIVPTEHARATLMAVDQGLVDAAIVYTTDVRLAKTAHVIWQISDAEQPLIVYTAAVLRSAYQARAARDYVAFMTHGPGRAELERAGFAPPP